MKKFLGIVFAKEIIKVGDIYEDCSYHAVLCLGSDYHNDELSGISLFDGSEPRCCSPRHCAPRRLTAAEVAHKLRNKDRWLEAETYWRATHVDLLYRSLQNEEFKKFGR